MDLSFYTGSTGVKAQQQRLDIIANNISNANNEGYRTLSSTFANLLYQNIRPNLDVQQGVGTRIARTNIDFSSSGINSTGSDLHYAINGDGFFAVQDGGTNEILYTRSGAFQMGQAANGTFYLVTPSGEYVLDANRNRIVVPQNREEGDWMPNLGVFTFAHYEGFEAVGDNLYRAPEGVGGPFVNGDARIEQGSLEMSNVDLANEMTHVVMAQRSYQLALRVVQTSDELANTMNNMR